MNVVLFENIIKILLHTHTDSDFSHKSNEGSHRRPHSYPTLNDAFYYSLRRGKQCQGLDITHTQRILVSRLLWKNSL